jgi:thiol-disulfide isomerase/thioredoxin
MQPLIITSMSRARVLILSLLLGAAGIVGFTHLRSAGVSGGEGSTPGADIRIVSKGEPLNLRDYLVPGKYTLFDYYADWCPPCRQLSPRLEELARRNPNLAVRKVDIVDWSHPVAQQQGVSDLPYLRLYDPQGKLVAEGDPVLKSLRTLFGLTDPPEAM